MASSWNVPALAALAALCALCAPVLAQSIASHSLTIWQPLNPDLSVTPVLWLPYSNNFTGAYYYDIEGNLVDSSVHNTPVGRPINISTIAQSVLGTIPATRVALRDPTVTYSLSTNATNALAQHIYTVSFWFQANGAYGVNDTSKETMLALAGGAQFAINATTMQWIWPGSGTLYWPGGATDQYIYHVVAYADSSQAAVGLRITEFNPQGMRTTRDSVAIETTLDFASYGQTDINTITLHQPDNTSSTAPGYTMWDIIVFPSVLDNVFFTEIYDFSPVSCVGVAYAGDLCQYPVFWRGLSTAVPTPWVWMSLANGTTQTLPPAGAIPMDFQGVLNNYGGHGLPILGADVQVVTNSSVLGTAYAAELDNFLFLNSLAPAEVVNTYTLSYWVAITGDTFSSDASNDTPIQLLQSLSTTAAPSLSPAGFQLIYGQDSNDNSLQIQATVSPQPGYIYQVVATVSNSTAVSLSVFEYDSSYNPTQNFPLTSSANVSTTYGIDTSSLLKINGGGGGGSDVAAWDMIIWKQVLTNDQIRHMYSTDVAYPNELVPTTAPTTTAAPTSTSVPTPVLHPLGGETTPPATSVAPTTTVAPTTKQIQANTTGNTATNTTNTTAPVDFTAEVASQSGLTTTTIAIISVAGAVAAVAVSALVYHFSARCKQSASYRNLDSTPTVHL
jgi:hypothetical protein